MPVLKGKVQCKLRLDVYEGIEDLFPLFACWDATRAGLLLALLSFQEMGGLKRDLGVCVGVTSQTG